MSVTALNCTQVWFQKSLIAPRLVVLVMGVYRQHAKGTTIDRLGVCCRHFRRIPRSAPLESCVKRVVEVLFVRTFDCLKDDDFFPGKEKPAFGAHHG